MLIGTVEIYCQKRGGMSLNRHVWLGARPLRGVELVSSPAKLELAIIRDSLNEKLTIFKIACRLAELTYSIN